MLLRDLVEHVTLNGILCPVKIWLRLMPNWSHRFLENGCLLVPAETSLWDTRSILLVQGLILT